MRQKNIRTICRKLVCVLNDPLLLGLHESLDKITADSISNVDQLWDIYKVSCVSLLSFQLIDALNTETETIFLCHGQKEFNKNYEPAEDAERKAVFEATLKRIYEHNALYDKGESTYTLGINQFADKKASEFKSGVILPSHE